MSMAYITATIKIAYPVQLLQPPSSGPPAAIEAFG